MNIRKNYQLIKILNYIEYKLKSIKKPIKFPQLSTHQPHRQLHKRISQQRTHQKPN